MSATDQEKNEMSESDKLKDEAEKEVKEHPQQISEGEQGIEKKLGMNTNADETSQHDQNTAPQGPAEQPVTEAGVLRRGTFVTSVTRVRFLTRLATAGSAAAKVSAGARA